MALVVMMMVSGHSLLLLGNWPHSDADDKEMFEHILHIGSNTMCTLTTFCLLEHSVHSLEHCLQAYPPFLAEHHIIRRALCAHHVQ